MRKQGGANSRDYGRHGDGFDLQRHPCSVTTGTMGALGTSVATLAFFAPCQLLQFPMQLLDLPTHIALWTHIALCLNHLRCLCLVWVVGNNPFNVTVCGN